MLCKGTLLLGVTFAVKVGNREVTYGGFVCEEFDRGFREDFGNG